MVPTKQPDQRTTLQADTRAIVPFQEPAEVFGLTLNQTNFSRPTTYFNNCGIGFVGHREDMKMGSVAVRRDIYQPHRPAKQWVMFDHDEWMKAFDDADK